jgi:crossover junction endodeoxyribonuclease RuvC
VGYGAAHKAAVAKMVQRLLHLAALPAPDAADALAIALAHAQDTSRYSLTAPKRI